MERGFESPCDKPAAQSESLRDKRLASISNCPIGFLGANRLLSFYEADGEGFEVGVIGWKTVGLFTQPKTLLIEEVSGLTCGADARAVRPYHVDAYVISGGSGVGQG